MSDDASSDDGVLGRGGLGTPILVARLPYEPRAVWQCGHCALLLVGTKDGRVYVDDGVNPLKAVQRHPLTVLPSRRKWPGIRALIRCPHCDGAAWAGDQVGNLLRIDEISTPLASPSSARTSYRITIVYPAPSERREGRDVGPGRVVALDWGRVDHDRAPRVYVLHENGSVFVAQGGRPLEQIRPAGRPFRWLFRQSNADDSPLWLIDASGVVAYASAQRANTQLVFKPEQHLRNIPTCLAVRRDAGGQLKTIFYGHERGVSIWWPDDDGPRELVLPCPAPIRSVQMWRWFDAEEGPRWILAATDSLGRILTWAGDLKTLPSLRKEGSHAEPPPLTLTPMRDEVLAVTVGKVPGANGVGPPGLHSVNVGRITCFLRNHEVYLLRVHDERHLRREAKAKHLDWWSNSLVACHHDPTKLREFVGKKLEGKAWEADEDKLRTILLEVGWYRRHNRTKASGGDRPAEHPSSIAVAKRAAAGRAVTSFAEAVVALGRAVMQKAAALPPEAVRRLGKIARRAALIEMHFVERNHRDWRHLVRWTRFLRKHFVLAHTYDAKVVGIDNLVTANAGFVDSDHRASSVDALIYAARLAADGIVVKDVWEPRSPVSALAYREAHDRTAPSRETAAEERHADRPAPALKLAAALRDGSIVELPTTPVSRRHGALPVIRPLHPSALRFGDYTNVLVPTDDGWWCAPREYAHDTKPRPLGDATEIVVEVAKPGQNLNNAAKDPQHTRGDRDVHAVAEIRASGAADAIVSGWLLALRSRTHPLAWLPAAEVQEHANSLAAARARRNRDDHGRTTESPPSPSAPPPRARALAGERVAAFGRPRRRLLLPLGTDVSGRRWVAQGGESGVLRVIPLGPGDTPTIGSAVPFAIGRPIRCGATWDGTLIVIGTGGDAGGEVIGIDISLDKPDKPDEPAFRVRFRDWLQHRVVAVARTKSQQGDMAVLDESGRVSWFRIDEQGHVRRWARHQAIDGGVAMIALPGGDLLVAGGPPDRQQVRRIALAPPAEIDGVVEDAIVTCMRAAGFRHPGGSGDWPDHARATALALLCAMPLRNGAVRAALTRARLARLRPGPELEGGLAEMVADALRGRPDDRIEFKAALAAAWRTSGLHGSSQVRRSIARVFQGQRLAGDWRASNKRRAALARFVIRKEFLALASPFGPAQDAELAKQGRHWIEELIFDEDPLVRLTALQALEATFADLVHAAHRDTADSDASAEVPFPYPAGKNRLIGGRWMVHHLTRYLRTFPPDAPDPVRCNVETFTALRVLVLFLELYSDSAMTVLHHLAVEGVKPEVFRLLRRGLPDAVERQRRPSAEAAARAVELYVPWPDPPTGVLGVIHYARELEAARLKEGTLDRARLEAQVRIYEVIQNLAEASTAAQIRAVKVSDLTTPAAPLAVLAMSDDSPHDTTERQPRLFDTVIKWLDEHITRLKEDVAKSNDFAQTWRAKLKTGPSREFANFPTHQLFEPERTAMEAVLRQWSSLVDEPMPRIGQTAGEWKLGELRPDDPRNRTFSVADAPKDVDVKAFVIQVQFEAPQDQVEADRERFDRLQKLSDKLASRRPKPTRHAEDNVGLLPLHCVVERGQQTWLVLRALDGWPSLKAWGDSQGPVARPVARLVAWIDAIAGVLDEMHAKGLCHGDVAPRNILVERDGKGAALVDYESVSFHDGRFRYDGRSRWTARRRDVPPEISRAFGPIDDDPTDMYRRSVATDAWHLFHDAYELAKKCERDFRRDGQVSEWLSNLQTIESTMRAMPPPGKPKLVRATVSRLPVSFSRPWDGSDRLLARFRAAMLNNLKLPIRGGSRMTAGAQSSALVPTILYLASNPTVQPPLDLPEEARLLKRELEHRAGIDGFKLSYCWNVRPADMLTALHQEKPAIAHFSGHSESGQLVFHGQGGGPLHVSYDDIADAFRVSTTSIQVAVLSACYTTDLAAMLIKHVDFVVGMTGKVENRAVRAFTLAFYGALAGGASAQKAFDLGCSALAMVEPADRHQPKCLVREGVDASRLFVWRR